MARVGFDEGVITTSDLLAAQTAWMAAKTDVVDAQIELATRQMLPFKKQFPTKKRLERLEALEELDALEELEALASNVYSLTSNVQRLISIF